MPVGYKLVMDGTSGMVYRKNVLTESTEIQSTMAHTLGGSISGSGFGFGFGLGRGDLQGWLSGPFEAQLRQTQPYDRFGEIGDRPRFLNFR